MNLTIETKVNAVRLRALAEAPRQVAQGQRRAINRTATRLRAQAVKGIGARVNLRAGYLRERLELYRSGPNRPFASVVGRKRATRLDRFPNRQVFERGKTITRKRSGISVRVTRSGGGKRIVSAFLVPLRRGKEGGAGGFGIAVRVSELARLGIDELAGAQGGSGSRRYQLLYSLSLAQLFQRQLESGLDQDVIAYYAAQLNAEMRRALARARA